MSPVTSSRIERQITNLIRSAVDPDLVDSDTESVRGKPDLISRYAKVAVFVDGCYWHGCPDHTKGDQAAQRRARDELVSDGLREDGWVVLRVWEHEEHLAPFIADASALIVRRAARRRAEDLAHIDQHAFGEWCDVCEMWPHAPIPQEDGWCARCQIHQRDHEYAKLPTRPAATSEKGDSE